MSKTNNSVFVKYWYLWIIVFLMPPLLYLLISLPCGFNSIGGKNAPSVWLGFWGGYLGAAISALVAFIILDKQIKANKNENENNRKVNELQNKANLRLQLNTLEYQQRMLWINDFKKVAVEYIAEFNMNNLVLAQNGLVDSFEDTYEITRRMLDGLLIAKAKLQLYQRGDEFSIRLYEDLNNLYKSFVSVTQDMHCLSNLMYNNQESADDPFSLSVYNLETIKNYDSFSNQLKKLIEDKESVPLTEFSSLAQQRREQVSNTFRNISSLLETYIKEEQERINQILLPK